MKKIYILGGAQTDFSKNYTKLQLELKDLIKETFQAGLNSLFVSNSDLKNLTKDHKVGAFVGNFASEVFNKQGHLGAYLAEVNPFFVGMQTSRCEAACASGSAALDFASAKLRAEEIDLAVVFGIELMKSVDASTCGNILGQAANYKLEAENIKFPFPKLFGSLVEEIVLKYQIDKNRLLNCMALISKNNYSNAKTNPLAQTRNWNYTDEFFFKRNTTNNPLIAEHLAKSDCSQLTDGGAIVFLANEKFTKRYCKQSGNEIQNLPFVKAKSCRTSYFGLKKKIQEAKSSAYLLNWTTQAVNDSYGESGLKPQNIDLFEIHDCFTSSEYALISCLGLTSPGEEYKIIESNQIEKEGKHPINLSGGLIGAGHPVGATGVRMMVDLFLQLTNKSYNQTKNPKNGLMLNIGGTASTSYVYIIGK